VEFLKRYFFWLGVAAAALVLLVIYVVTVTPVKKANRTLQAQISSVSDRLHRWATRKIEEIPTRAKIKALKDYREEVIKKRKACEEWYEQRESDFDNRFFEDATIEEGEEIPSSVVYKEVYSEHTHDLLKEFEDTFGASKGAFSFYDWGEGLPSPEEVRRSQKEYWLYETFLKVLSAEGKHGITELSRLTFGGGGRESASTFGAPGGEMMLPGARGRFEEGFGGAGARAEKAKWTKDPSGYFWVIPFELKVTMDARQVPSLLESLLSMPRFARIRTVKMSRTTDVEKFRGAIPEVYVAIDGEILDFITEKEKKGAAKASRTR